MTESTNSECTLVVVSTGADSAVPSINQQSDVSGATNDAHLVELWLAGRSVHTQRAYSKDAGSFLRFVGKPLPTVKVADLQRWVGSLTGAHTTRARRVSAVKSLLTFAHRTGYCPFNVGTVVQPPKAKNRLAERIMAEKNMLFLLGSAPPGRDNALLRFLYHAAGRVSETCGVRWRDLQPRDEAGQVTLFGKGGKTRVVLLPASTWRALLELRGDAGLDDHVFRSRTGKPLDPSAVWRIVRKAAKRAGIDSPVSPHWFRHAHASHALDRNAPVSLVQTTLGHASVATTSRYLHARPGASSGLYLAD